MSLLQATSSYYVNPSGFLPEPTFVFAVIRMKSGSHSLADLGSLDSSLVGRMQHIECQINDRPSLNNTDVDPVLWSVARQGSPSGLI